MNSPFATIQTTPDMTLRYGFWPSETERRRGTLLLLNGRAEFMEKHLETVGELNERGFDVYSLDWRGQGGSLRQLPDPHKGYVACYEDYLADLSVFYRKILHPRGHRPLFLLAHSMGGHIALRFFRAQPDAFSKAALISPMIDIHTSPLPASVARVITRFAIQGGFAEQVCFGAGGYSEKRVRFKNNPLTSDARRFWAAQDIMRQNPHLTVGSVTWAWLAATFRSIDRLKRKGEAERIQTPLLMICAQKDRIVSLSAQRLISLRLPNCRFTILPGARHEILCETDAIRACFWKEFDAFFGKKGLP
ncbi:MAG: alpha/beta hydrolase [Desulfobacterales bacterium]|nr:alpha/beta hydrolase [Desulfobacterales bacterium]